MYNRSRPGWQNGNPGSCTADVGAGAMLVYAKGGHSLTGRRNLRAGGGTAVPPPSVSGRSCSLFSIASFLLEQPGIAEAARKPAIAANPRNTALQNAMSG